MPQINIDYEREFEDSLENVDEMPPDDGYSFNYRFHDGGYN